MHLIKRLYFTAFGTVDSVVSRIQNHDALVTVSLRDLQYKTKQAQGSFNTLGRTLRKIEEEIENADREAKQWASRAKVKGEEKDRTTALECLRRGRRASETIVALRKQKETTEVSYRKLQATIGELQTAQKSLALKHQELKARQDCEAIGETVLAMSPGEAELMLNRWEDSLGIAPAAVETVDTLQSEFERVEETADLEAELNKLLSQN